MPELPEVETVRRGLESELVGEVISKVEVLRDQSIEYPNKRNFVKNVTGKRIQSMSRRGKYLLFHFDDGTYMVAHLRMSGRFVVFKSGPKPSSKTSALNHIRVKFTFASARELWFDDTRVFGRLWFVEDGEDLNQAVPGLANLGMEPLNGMRGQHLQKSFANCRRAIKTALLDQTFVAGIGNIYADECLHLSKLHPLRPAAELSLAELNTLAKNIKLVLEAAIEAGGSTIRDYKDSTGVNGNYQNEAYVYGRTGQPCRVCKGTITRIKLNGRSTHFCPSCQPL
jgi:formamidopyrimidine-DNA glycosylase